jgi:hypothetical protein
MLGFQPKSLISSKMYWLGHQSYKATVSTASLVTTSGSKKMLSVQASLLMAKMDFHAINASPLVDPQTKIKFNIPAKFMASVPVKFWMLSCASRCCSTTSQPPEDAALVRAK